MHADAEGTSPCRANPDLRLLGERAHRRAGVTGQAFSSETLARASLRAHM